MCVQAAYLAKAGKSVCVLERRHVLGGAAVTEEIIDGFKFSRASYLLSLFRPQIVEELELQVGVLTLNTFHVQHIVHSDTACAGT
jgi:phytoene dehydrogenase-like protein